MLSERVDASLNECSSASVLLGRARQESICTLIYQASTRADIHTLARSRPTVVAGVDCGERLPRLIPGRPRYVDEPLPGVRILPELARARSR